MMNASNFLLQSGGGLCAPAGMAAGHDMGSVSCEFIIDDDE